MKTVNSQKNGEMNCTPGPDGNVDVTSGSDSDVTVTFDLERMKKALEGPFHVIPAGLTANEINEFILSIANKDKEDNLWQP